MPGPGELLGDGVAELFGSALDQLYKSVWNGSQALMRGSFTLADQFTTFSLSNGGGGLAAGSPLASVWPTMRWIAIAVAVGLFFAQLAMTAVRGGRGMFRSVTGPLQFALAMALTVGGVGALLAATDGLTTFLLQTGLGSGNFVGVFDAPAVATRIGETPDLADVADENIRATVLAFVALFGFIPASLSFALQMIFRQAAVLVLIATSPVTAAGLMTDATSAWFWRALRWMIAAALIKPVLALILVIGINMLSSTTGVAGLIAGAAVLLISVFAPLTLYRLLAFVDPASGHRQAIRMPSPQGGQPRGDGGAGESANTTRFAQAAGSGGPAAGGAAGRSAAGSGAAGGGAAAGGAAASGGAAAAAGPAGAAVAAVQLVRQAAKAGNAWANNQMTGHGVGHPGGPPPSASARRPRGGQDGPVAGDGDRPGGAAVDTGPVSAPPDTGPRPGPTDGGGTGRRTPPGPPAPPPPEPRPAGGSTPPPRRNPGP